MAKNILAGVAGVVAAFFIVWLVEKIGHGVYPPPADLDFKDMEAMRVYVSTLPTGVFLFVGAAWFLGAFGGTLIACKIGDARAIIYAIVVGGLVLVATAANLIMIPHPIGFAIPAVAGIVIATWLGMKLGAGKTGE